MRFMMEGCFQKVGTAKLFNEIPLSILKRITSRRDFPLGISRPPLVTANHLIEPVADQEISMSHQGFLFLADTCE